MRVYQFRHVGLLPLLLPAFLPTSAIILAFEVLRQTNFRYSQPPPSTILLQFLAALTMGRRERAEIIAEQIELSKCPS